MKNSQTHQFLPTDTPGKHPNFFSQKPTQNPVEKFFSSNRKVLLPTLIKSVIEVPKTSPRRPRLNFNNINGKGSLNLPILSFLANVNNINIKGSRNPFLSVGRFLLVIPVTVLLIACDSTPPRPNLLSSVPVLWPGTSSQTYNSLVSTIDETDSRTSTAVELARSFKDERVFAWGLIGEAARYSDSCVQLEELLRKPNAVPALEALLKASDVSVAGRTFAMLGLRSADYPMFLKYKAELSTATLIVERQNGCTIWNEPLPEILKQIDEGTISLRPEALPQDV